jgi:hypothetical protein
LVPCYFASQNCWRTKFQKPAFSLGRTEEASLRESEKFRKYAADCIRIQMSGKDRQALLEIADAWETRAQDLEKREKGFGT